LFIFFDAFEITFLYLQIPNDEEIDVHETHETPVTEMIENDVFTTSLSLPPSSLPSPALPSSKKRKKPEDVRLDKAFELFTASSVTISDESQHFGNFVASKLRKYSIGTQSSIQHAFMRIFLNADNRIYEQPLYNFDYPSRSTTSNISQVSNLSSPYTTSTPTKTPETLQIPSSRVDVKTI